ncbi:hypothetical protein HanXRQr2_Chr10g0436521 [Helianthus annuus]|uniref:Uncharacterized protein n=1 Tax=Helianthus annuus TaxID=4232 RepID=A0A9K3N445_HELAN|nr:hypothetical protein HanXRQr2_Chr10g0436521 [Helianthus annuus]
MIPFKSLVSDSNLALVPVAYVELVSPEGRRKMSLLLPLRGLLLSMLQGMVCKSR